MSLYRKPLNLILYEMLVSKHYISKNSNERKGISYERQIGNIYEKKGYFVEYRGIRQGKRDGGIDLIASKENVIIFIQCKNHTHKIKQKEVRAFLGDIYIYQYKHNNFQDKEILAHFYSANGFKLSALYYQEEIDFLKLFTIPYEWANINKTQNRGRQLSFSFYYATNKYSET